MSNTDDAEERAGLMATNGSESSRVFFCEAPEMIWDLPSPAAKRWLAEQSGIPTTKASAGESIGPTVHGF